MTCRHKQYEEACGLCRLELVAERDRLAAENADLRQRLGAAEAEAAERDAADLRAEVVRLKADLWDRVNEVRDDELQRLRVQVRALDAEAGLRRQERDAHLAVAARVVIQPCIACRTEYAQLSVRSEQRCPECRVADARRAAERERDEARALLKMPRPNDMERGTCGCGAAASTESGWCGWCGPGGAALRARAQTAIALEEACMSWFGRFEPGDLMTVRLSTAIVTALNASIAARDARAKVPAPTCPVCLHEEHAAPCPVRMSWNKACGCPNYEETAPAPTGGKP